jgi:superfamily II DNA or RNA helicase
MWQELHAGQRVMARDEPWRVIAFKAWNDCAEVELAGAAASNDGLAIVLLLPFDRVERIGGNRPSAGNAAADAAVRRSSRRAWMRAVAGAAYASRLADGLQAAHRAAIDLLPWQLEPAMALASGAASRILIADAVGSGKTVQALAALAELQARGEAERVLVVTPAGLRDQWAGELASRFQQTCLVADAAFLAGAALELPPDVNPWSLPGVYVVSLDFLKRREVMHGIEGLWWDLVVADEAHLAAPGTDRGKALDRAAARAARVILLTATPYAFDREGFAALTATGRDSRPAGDDDFILFRRSRASLAIEVPLRRTRLLRIRLTPQERRLHRLLERYTFRVWCANASPAARLAMIVLRKRALSSAWAAARTIERRLALLEQPDDSTVRQIALPFDLDQEGEASADDTLDDVVIGAPGLSDSKAERDLLANLAAAAAACAGRESKLRSLKRLLRRTNEAAIVFTEYRDTLEHLAAELSTRPHALLHGGLSRDERRAACSALNDKAVSLLLATDAAGEGLNLHVACRWVINFELPWNPARLEQRAGRVDRYGQRRRPHVVHFAARDTAESLVLARLEARMRRARQAGWLDDVWPAEPVVAEAVLGGKRVSEREPHASVEGPSVPDGITSLAVRACADAALMRHLSKSAAHGPLVLEISPSRLVRRRNGFDRLVARCRTLFVHRFTITDGAGRVADSTIVASSSPGGDATYSSARLRHVGQFRHAATERLLQRWRFVSARKDSSHREVQPALFDRRALDLARADAIARAAAAQDLSLRIDRLHRSRTLTLEPPELLLVARARPGREP